MMNLIVALISFAALLLLVLLAARGGKPYLFAASVAFIIMSNITVQMNTEIVPGVVISWAIIIYSMVYLVTDFVIEFYGRSAAYRLAALNLGVQYVLWGYVWLSLMANPITTDASPQVYQTMRSLFGTSTQVTIAATIAALGPFSDIFATARLREFLKSRQIFQNDALNVLVRAKLSTLIGEFVNTLLFFGIILVGSGVDSYTLASIVISATLVKWAISMLDAPFLYFFFRYIGQPSDVSPELVANKKR